MTEETGSDWKVIHEIIYDMKENKGKTLFPNVQSVVPLLNLTRRTEVIVRIPYQIMPCNHRYVDGRNQTLCCCYCNETWLVGLISFSGFNEGGRL